MSKKKKFKKFSNAQLIQEIEKSSVEEKNNANITLNEPLPENKKTILNNQIAEHQFAKNSYIKNDLKRVGIVLGVCILILVSATIADRKTALFSNLANSLVEVLHINQ